MSAELVIHIDVPPELQEAYDYYEIQREGLGEEFLAELRLVYSRIHRQPRVHQIIENGVRKSLLKRFPFAVYYREEPSRIVVVAVLHTSRNPDVWKKRV